MFLELENVTVHYGDFTAVKNFSMSQEEGSFTCLLGPSGCGKTTLLRSIGGFIPQVKGRIVLAEKVLDMPAEERPIATVFQSYGLFPHMTVGENICYGLRIRRVDKKRQTELLNNMLERLGLSGYAKKKVQELSGGEQQRVALARSLIIQPQLLLLDEPLSNLDAKLRIHLRAELKRVQRDFGITTILVTHDQAEAFELGDRIILMNKGEKIEEGSAEELYANPKADFTREFLGASTIDPRTNEAIRPEDWLIFPAGEGELDVQICKRVFQAEQIHYYCRTCDGQELSSVVLNRAGQFLPSEGDKVSLTRAK